MFTVMVIMAILAGLMLSIKLAVFIVGGYFLIKFLRSLFD